MQQKSLETAIQHIYDLITIIVVAVMIIIIFSIPYIHKKYPTHFNKFMLSFPIVAVAFIGVSSLITFLYMFMDNQIGYKASDLLEIFVYGLFQLTCFFHIVAFKYACSIRNLIGQDSLIGQNWVKSIDYIYLLLSSFSILRIVISTTTTAEGSTYFSGLAAVFLGVAVALRLTRTSIEIFEWDKRQGNPDDIKYVLIFVVIIQVLFTKILTT